MLVTIAPEAITEFLYNNSGGRIRFQEIGKVCQILAGLGSINTEILKHSLKISVRLRIEKISLSKGGHNSKFFFLELMNTNQQINPSPIIRIAEEAKGDSMKFFWMVFRYWFLLMDINYPISLEEFYKYRRDIRIKSGWI